MIAQALFGLGPQELIIILVVILVLFGGAKLAGLGKASGQAIREFKEEITGTKPESAEAVTASGDEAKTPPAE